MSDNPSIVIARLSRDMPLFVVCLMGLMDQIGFMLSLRLGDVMKALVETGACQKQPHSGVNPFWERIVPRRTAGRGHGRGALCLFPIGGKAGSKNVAA